MYAMEILEEVERRSNMEKKYDTAGMIPSGRVWEICKNTANAAKPYKMRHTAPIADRIKEAQEALGLSPQYSKALDVLAHEYVLSDRLVELCTDAQIYCITGHVPEYLFDQLKETIAEYGKCAEEL